MEKRFQVFVSSTYEDLRDERQEVMQALLELDCIPAGMELFPAANEDQWTLIRKVIEDCDYYIVVIGGRYGSLGPTGISYTQMEYEYAISQNKPIIGFLHKDPSSIPVKKTEKTPENQVKLDQFRTLVQQKMCKYWLTPSDLGSVVSRSLVMLIKSTPAVGWVRADLLPDTNTTEELLRLRQQIDELQNQLVESQQFLPMGFEDLSQGDDVILVKYKYILGKSMTWDNHEFKTSPDITIQSVYDTTWNNIFSLISPLLIDEASDNILRRALTSVIEGEIVSYIRTREDFEGYALMRIDIDDNDFNMIKVQFLALKLIAKSTRRKNRSVSDKSTYWTLTPNGVNAMMMLRAVRKIPSNDVKP